MGSWLTKRIGYPGGYRDEDKNMSVPLFALLLLLASATKPCLLFPFRLGRGAFCVRAEVRRGRGENFWFSDLGHMQLSFLGGSSGGWVLKCG
jgi:hypothetical protein